MIVYEPIPIHLSIYHRSINIFKFLILGSSIYVDQTYFLITFFCTDKSQLQCLNLYNLKLMGTYKVHLNYKLDLL